jgi:5'-nucleotidase
MGLIERERQIDKNLLLLDAGDFCQGTPYFNYYKGRIEIEAMNRMGYDAVTLGNHEFDYGIDTLAAVLKGADFAVVCANYDVRGTALEGIVKPYTILRRNGIKIGIFGLGCAPNGLISDKNFLPIQYLSPYPIAQQMADTLRQQGCSIVICLSHLGTVGKAPEDYNDIEMAGLTRGIHVIIGGHTHQLKDNLRVANLDGDSIPVCQMGKSGVYLGKIVLNINDKHK